MLPNNIEKESDFKIDKLMELENIENFDKLFLKKLNLFCSNKNIEIQNKNKILEKKNIELQKENLQIQKIINGFKNIHGDTYDYSKMNFSGLYNKITIICKKHGCFEMKPITHFKIGCKNCVSKKPTFYSKVSIKYLNFISIYFGIKIIHAENGKEFRIPNTRIRVDGYCEELKTVFEFYGDYYHGNSEKFNHDEYNKTTKCTFGELYKKTIEREKLIIDAGYKLKFIWENDWYKLNKRISILQKKFRSCR